MAFHGVSIDSPAARIFDDAIWVARNGDGWKLRVAITDVSFWVPLGSPEDMVARQIGYSRLDRNARTLRLFEPQMQYERLGLRSLSGQPVLCAVMEIAPDLTVTSVDVERDILGNLLSVSFAESEAFLLEGADPLLKGFMTAALELATALNKRRIARFRSEDGTRAVPEWMTDAMNQPGGCGTLGASVVNEIMVLTNATLTDMCVVEEVPLLWRFRPPSAPGVYLRSYLSVSPSAHSGLDLAAYARFTSPIRRYEDIVNHRNMMARLSNLPVPYEMSMLEVMVAHYNRISDEIAETARIERHASLRREEAERAESASILEAELSAEAAKHADGQLGEKDDQPYPTTALDTLMLEMELASEGALPARTPPAVRTMRDEAA